MPTRELFIVFNPGSGHQDQQRSRDAIARVLEDAGRPYRFIAIEGGDVRAACRQGARLAAASEGALVSAGGDGTLNAAAQAAVGEDCVLGVIPQGTFNVFAREHGIPLDPAEAARVLLEGEVRHLQVGAANQQLFLVNASVGLYPKLLADREEAKRKLGRKRWVAKLAALRTLWQWHARLRLDMEVDGEPRRLDAASLVVCGNRLQLEAIGAPEDFIERVEAGALAGIAAHPLDRTAKLRVLADGLLGRLAAAPDIETFAFRSLTMGTRGARRLRVALDGEVRWMEQPLHVALAARRLKVLLPRNRDDGEK